MYNFPISIDSNASKWQLVENDEVRVLLTVRSCVHWGDVGTEKVDVPVFDVTQAASSHSSFPFCLEIPNRKVTTQINKAVAWWLKVFPLLEKKGRYSSPSLLAS